MNTNLCSKKNCTRSPLMADSFRQEQCIRSDGKHTSDIVVPGTNRKRIDTWIEHRFGLQI